jgi:hypothetical protein
MTGVPAPTLRNVYAAVDLLARTVTGPSPVGAR